MVPVGIEAQEEWEQGTVEEIVGRKGVGLPKVVEFAAEMNGITGERGETNDDDIKDNESGSGEERGSESAKSATTRRMLTRAGRIEDRTGENPAESSAGTHPKKTEDDEVGGAFVEALRQRSEQVRERGENKLAIELNDAGDRQETRSNLGHFFVEFSAAIFA